MKNNNQTDKVALSAKYVGLQAGQNITENYQLALESDQIKYEYQYNNNVQFTDSVAIEEFSEDNSMILNNYEEEQVASFMQAVQQRIEEVNKKQMEELGLEEDENPLQYVIPQLGENFSTLKAINTSNINEEEVNAFNQKFENYEIARSNALENFLGAWGEHFSYNTHQTEKSFLKALYELIPYFSIDFQLIENIKDCRNDRDSLYISVDKLLTVLSKQIKPTKQSLIKRIFHKLCKRTNHKSS